MVRPSRYFAHVAAFIAVFAPPGCSNDQGAGGPADASLDGAITTSPPPALGYDTGTPVSTWRCETTLENKDAGAGTSTCTCTRFVVPVDTSDVSAECAPAPCCITDSADDCDCFSASSSQAMSCDDLVTQTNSVDMAQGMPPQAKRVAQCPP
ncbi:MAG TPA: hypothetical protein VHC69_28995 [Polyangiaceae bacterium]|nr:hypothetical protein [Polyangiaceae bacterium]